MISSLKNKTSGNFAKRHQEGTGHNLSPHSVFCFRIPRYMDDGMVRLRPLRISDIQFIRTELRDKDFLRVIGLTTSVSGSSLSLWWWLRKTFILRYAIEADSRLIGFMGLYHLVPGQSTELTLVIPDDKRRRLGYGTRAFSLLAQNIERYSSVEKLIVKVKPDNEAARSFWSKLGFEKKDDQSSLQAMSFAVKSLNKEP